MENHPSRNQKWNSLYLCFWKFVLYTFSQLPSVCLFLYYIKIRCSIISHHLLIGQKVGKSKILDTVGNLKLS